MTAEGWEVAQSPDELLHAIRERASPRKLRLFACACCRPLLGRVSRPGNRQKVEAAERFAEGWLPEEQFLSRFTPRRGRRTGRLAEAARSAFDSLGWPPAKQTNGDLNEKRHEFVWRAWEPGECAEYFTNQVCLHAIHARALLALGYDGTDPAAEAFREAVEVVEAEYAGVFREVFGNPFRPAALDPGWWTDTAVSLAKGMYAARDFGPMPILADALQDAGCEDEQILAHCRDAGRVHVRGCWVVDLVLGKE